MSRRPIISTISPCFRMEKYLEVFLERLPHQSLFENVEIFLDLNEPNANELKIVKKYQKMYGSRLNVHVAKKVDPIGASMNRCIKKSKGDFLAIWNVDDLRTHNSLEQQLNTFEEFPNSALVYGPYKVVNEFNSEKGRLVDNQRLSPQKFKSGMSAGPFFLFPRSHISKTGLFDEQLKSGADFDFVQRLLTVGEAISTTALLGYYLDEGLGASTRPNSKQPIERTVIELRYGKIASIDPFYLDSVGDYDLSRILVSGKWIRLDELISNYSDLRSENARAFKNKLQMRRKVIKVLFFPKRCFQFIQKKLMHK